MEEQIGVGALQGHEAQRVAPVPGSQPHLGPSAEPARLVVEHGRRTHAIRLPTTEGVKGAEVGPSSARHRGPVLLGG